jgi:glycerol-3-phosphate acyltransferase PlsY
LIDHQDLVLYKLFFGLAAVAGHIFPVYEKFKGGKGVATLLGMILSVQSEAALLCILVFLVVFLIFKYVSLGSMTSALAFPILLCLPRFSPNQPIVVLFAFALFALVVITHQKNIVRLLHGEENKAKIRIRRR